MIVFDIKPCTKPRMTMSDRVRKGQIPRPPVARYLAFKQELQLKANLESYALTDRTVITFVMPMAKSWSKKKRKAMEHQPHQQTPDRDNLEKAFLDALTDDDSFNFLGCSKKMWGKVGKIVIHNNDYLDIIGNLMQLDVVSIEDK